MSRTCDCPTPPGGQITCEEDQLAVCSIEDGKIVSGCFSQPAYLASFLEPQDKQTALMNWALSVILDSERDLDQTITRYEVEILDSGSYTDLKTGRVVTFQLPIDSDLQATGGGELAGAL